MAKLVFHHHNAVSNKLTLAKSTVDGKLQKLALDKSAVEEKVQRLSHWLKISIITNISLSLIILALVIARAMK